MSLSEKARNDLIERAIGVRDRAYAPYSKYHVGAALLAATGEIYEGINVENAAYPSSMCAERTAVFQAVTAGERNFTAIAVASSNGGSPCGACRQVLAEFGTGIIVIVVDDTGKVLIESGLSELLPESFGPADLDIG